MTNKEAIAIIRKEYLCVDRDCDIERNCGKCDLMMPSKEPILEAYKVAIKALEQLTSYEQTINKLTKAISEQEPCDDAISRQAVQDYIAKYLSQYLYNDVREAVEVIDEYIGELPSVKPQEPKTEKVIKMRDATPEERESVEKYVKSISKPTGVDFWDLEQEPCRDAISRDQATSEYADWYGYNYENNFFYKRLRSMPSVTPQQKTGHWIRGHFGFECSNCHKSIEGKWDDNIDDITGTLFCPDCGARMVQESEG